MKKKLFKYFEQTDNRWPKHPKPWTKVEAFSLEGVFDILKENWRVWDCDGGGDREYFVAISDGDRNYYYKVDHDFYAYRYEIEGTSETEFTVENIFEVRDSTKEETHIPDDRDWLNISEFNYKLKKWPPANV